MKFNLFNKLLLTLFLDKIHRIAVASCSMLSILSRFSEVTWLFLYIKNLLGQTQMLL